MESQVEKLMGDKLASVRREVDEKWRQRFAELRAQVKEKEAKRKKAEAERDQKRAQEDTVRALGGRGWQEGRQEQQEGRQEGRQEQTREQQEQEDRASAVVLAAAERLNIKLTPSKIQPSKQKNGEAARPTSISSSDSPAKYQHPPSKYVYADQYKLETAEAYSSVQKTPAQKTHKATTVVAFGKAIGHFGKALTVSSSVVAGEVKAAKEEADRLCCGACGHTCSSNFCGECGQRMGGSIQKAGEGNPSEDDGALKSKHSALMDHWSKLKHAADIINTPDSGAQRQEQRRAERARRKSGIREETSAPAVNKNLASSLSSPAPTPTASTVETHTNFTPTNSGNTESSAEQSWEPKSPVALHWMSEASRWRRAATALTSDLDKAEGEIRELRQTQLTRLVDSNQATSMALGEVHSLEMEVRRLKAVAATATAMCVEAKGGRYAT
jgi:hypothetical protein